MFLGQKSREGFPNAAPESQCDPAAQRLVESDWFPNPNSLLWISSDDAYQSIPEPWPTHTKVRKFAMSEFEEIRQSFCCWTAGIQRALRGGDYGVKRTYGDAGESAEEQDLCKRLEFQNMCRIPSLAEKSTGMLETQVVARAHTIRQRPSDSSTMFDFWESFGSDEKREESFA